MTFASLILFVKRLKLLKLANLLHQLFYTVKLKFFLVGRILYPFQHKNLYLYCIRYCTIQQSGHSRQLSRQPDQWVIMTNDHVLRLKLVACYYRYCKLWQLHFNTEVLFFIAFLCQLLRWWRSRCREANKLPRAQLRNTVLKFTLTFGPRATTKYIFIRVKWDQRDCNSFLSKDGTQIWAN